MEFAEIGVVGMLGTASRKGLRASSHVNELMIMI
jgi:hypothetical protein